MIVNLDNRMTVNFKLREKEEWLRYVYRYTLAVLGTMEEQKERSRFCGLRDAHRLQRATGSEDKKHL